MLAPTIEPIVARDLIQYVLFNGMRRGLGWNVWTNMPFRRPTNVSLDATFSSRLNPDINWDWIDTPVTSLVQKEVEKVSHLYKRFHRASVVVQDVDKSLLMHTDGTLPEFQPLHASNRYLALKIPLTVEPGNNGCPLVEYDGRLWRYDVGNHHFALNEMEIRHGSFAPGIHRGVIFLDGLLDMSALESAVKAPIPLFRYDGPEPLPPSPGAAGQ